MSTEAPRGQLDRAKIFELTRDIDSIVVRHVENLQSGNIGLPFRRFLEQLGNIQQVKGVLIASRPGKRRRNEDWLGAYVLAPLSINQEAQPDSSSLALSISDAFNPLEQLTLQFEGELFCELSYVDLRGEEIHKVLEDVRLEIQEDRKPSCISLIKIR